MTYLIGGAQVLSIVVAQMVVAHDAGGLDARRDEEIHENAFHLGLATLEIVASNEHLVLLSELHHAWDKGRYVKMRY